MKTYKNNTNMKDETKIALLEQSIGHINETMLRMEKRFDSIDKRFDSIDKRFDSIDKRFEIVDKKFDKVDARFYSLESNFKQEFNRLDGKIDSNFKWLLGAMLGIFVLNGLIPIFAHIVQKLINFN